MDLKGEGHILLDALLVIVGATGVGKTEVAIELAKRIRVEIISADSRQIYKEMDIGTAKPSSAIRQEVPHHLIDLVLPDQIFNVADFKTRAEAIIKELQKTDKLPALVGGSGLYIKAVIDGLFVGPGADWKLRDKLKGKEKGEGAGTLYQELKRVDPSTASRLHPHDQRRIVRALEVYYLSGRPISYHQTQFPSVLVNTVMIGLRRGRESLCSLIDARVDRMIAEGLIEEVEYLFRKGYSEDLPSLQGLGYQQIIGYLKGGYPEEEAIRLIKRDTRRFAKRQMSWFKRDKRILWIEVEKFSSFAAISDRIVEILIEKIPQVKLAVSV